MVLFRLHEYLELSSWKRFFILLNLDFMGKTNFEIPDTYLFFSFNTAAFKDLMFGYAVKDLRTKAISLIYKQIRNEHYIWQTKIEFLRSSRKPWNYEWQKPVLDRLWSAKLWAKSNGFNRPARPSGPKKINKRKE